MRSNLSELGKIAELVFSLGAEAIKLNPCMEMGKAKDFTKELPSIDDYIKLAETSIKLNKKWPGKILSTIPPVLLAPYGPRHIKIWRSSCHYKNILGILPDGSISLCGIGITHPKTIVGNVEENGVREVWLNEYGYLKELHELTYEDFEGMCSKCMFKSFCEHFCPAFSYEMYGRFSASYPICEELYKGG